MDGMQVDLPCKIELISELQGTDTTVICNGSFLNFLIIKDTMTESGTSHGIQKSRFSHHVLQTNLSVYMHTAPAPILRVRMSYCFLMSARLRQAMQRPYARLRGHPLARHSPLPPLIRISEFGNRTGTGGMRKAVEVNGNVLVC